MRRPTLLAYAMLFAVGCTGADPTTVDPGNQGKPGAGTPDLSDPSNPNPPIDPPGGAPDLGTPPTNNGGGDGYLTADQKAVAEAMTSIWENDTPKIDYAYSENINDGRGYTSGRAGFCTGTGDAIQVIDCYDKLRTAANGNLMAKYMPALKAIDNKLQSSGKDQGDTSTLDAVGNWVNDWHASYNTATTQADFKTCQDQINDLLYYTPAMKSATSVGLTTALTKAAIYDMFINQGDDALVKSTSSALKLTGKIGNGVTEDMWLQKFIELRRDVLAGDSTWATSVDRVAGYEKARRRANWDLSKPVDSAVKASQCWPTGAKYEDSLYSAYTIQPDANFATSSGATGCQ